MGSIDEALKANESYAGSFNLSKLAMLPARKRVVVTCMDARMNVESMLKLKAGDAHVLRNAGGIVTEDVLRSLLISHYLQGTNELMVINHTECGVLGLNDESLRSRLERETGKAALSPDPFHGFSNLEENVRRQGQKVRSHPWIPTSITIRGFVYDVKTGRLREVALETAKGA